jgi:hypothetical protein
MSFPNPDPNDFSTRTRAEGILKGAEKGSLSLKDAETFMALMGATVGVRYSSPGMAWDTVPRDTGHFNHPISDVGVRVVADGGYFMLQAFGAYGVGGANETERVQLAFDVVAAEGGELRSQPNCIHHVYGEMHVKRYSTVNLRSCGAAFLQKAASGSFVIHAGAKFFSDIWQDHPDYVGPALEMNTAKSVERYTRASRKTVIRSLIDGVFSSVKDATNVGFLAYDGYNGSGSRGISFADVEVDVQRFWRGAEILSANDGYITSNRFKIMVFGFKEGLRAHYKDRTTDNIMYDNDVEVVTQTSRTDVPPGLPIYFDMPQSKLSAYSWDFSNVDPDYPGHQLILGPNCRASNIVLRVAQLVPGVATWVSEATNISFVNNVDVRSTFTQSLNTEPAGVARGQILGNQDNALHFVRRFANVTFSGATPMTGAQFDVATNGRSNFATIANATECIVTIEMPSSGSNDYRLNSIGVEFGSSPDKAKIEVSADGTTWNTLTSVGYSGVGVVPTYFTYSTANNVACRYIRFTFENNTAKSINIYHIFADSSGVTNLPGAFLSKWRPIATDRMDVAADISGITAGVGYYAFGVKVVGAQRPSIANAAVGTEVSTINSILTALRAHGLIAT